MTLTLAALAIAAPSILFVLWPLLRRRDLAEAHPLDQTRAELEAEKVLALRALRELTLDHQAGHLADEDYAELRARYEARASEILKRLDSLPPERAARGAPAAPAPVAPVPWSRQPVVLTGAAVGLVVFGVVLGVLVVRFTGPAPPDSPADAVPGPVAGSPAMPGAPPTGSDGSPRSIPPGMLQGMLQAARASLQAGRVQEAIAAYQAVLKREPSNVDALTHFGLILAMADVNHADRALEFFDRALAVNPDYPEALSYTALVRYELKQDYAGAIAAWERFAKVVPDATAREEALARIREAKLKLAVAPRPSGPPAPGVPRAKPERRGMDPKP